MDDIVRHVYSSRKNSAPHAPLRPDVVYETFRSPSHGSSLVSAVAHPAAVAQRKNYSSGNESKTLAGKGEAGAHECPQALFFSLYR